MRSEQEMMRLILETAENDPQVRAVGMNGSRTNPNAKRDCFQDYDIVFLVVSLKPYLEHPEWVDRFGARIIMQTPTDFDPPSDTPPTRYTYLMQFQDGNRIDLTLCPMAEKEYWNNGDSLSMILLDKDAALPPLPAPDDSTYRVVSPSECDFRNCCNEFWWVAPYAAKGIWRQEMLYVMEHLDIIRGQLLRVLSWEAGYAHRFQISVGKSYKYLEQYLEQADWERLCRTFPSAGYQNIWDALFCMCDLFREHAVRLGGQMHFAYCHAEDDNVTRFLRRIRSMPPDAVTI